MQANLTVDDAYKEQEQAHVAAFDTKTSIFLTPAQLQQIFPTGVPTDIEVLMIDCNWSPDHARHMALHAVTSTLAPHFIIDSGATGSTCNQLEVFSNLVPDRTPIKIANGNICYTEDKDDIGIMKGVYTHLHFPIVAYLSPN